eukprot:Platyproteum_vivax@DN366_c0_g1_i1.p1
MVLSHHSHHYNVRKVQINHSRGLASNPSSSTLAVGCADKVGLTTLFAEGNSNPNPDLFVKGIRGGCTSMLAPGTGIVHSTRGNGIAGAPIVNFWVRILCVDCNAAIGSDTTLLLESS